jgi:hypothetical protein
LGAESKEKYDNKCWDGIRPTLGISVIIFSTNSEIHREFRAEPQPLQENLNCKSPRNL